MAPGRPDVTMAGLRMPVRPTSASRLVGFSMLAMLAAGGGVAAAAKDNPKAAPKTAPKAAPKAPTEVDEETPDTPKAAPKTAPKAPTEVDEETPAEPKHEPKPEPPTADKLAAPPPPPAPPGGAAADAAPGPTDTVGFSDRLFVRSPGGEVVLFPGALVQVDGAAFPRQPPKSGFYIRRARVQLTGWLGRIFYFVASADFAPTPAAGGDDGGAERAPGNRQLPLARAGRRPLHRAGGAVRRPLHAGEQDRGRLHDVHRTRDGGAFARRAPEQGDRRDGARPAGRRRLLLLGRRVQRRRPELPQLRQPARCDRPRHRVPVRARRKHVPAADAGGIGLVRAPRPGAHVSRPGDARRPALSRAASG